jgi:hypothetical protein
MAGVCGAFAFPRRAERLTGTGACPDRPIVGPSGESKRMTPDADAGEEMTLGIAEQIGRLNFED